MKGFLHRRFGFINRVLELRYRSLLVALVAFLLLPSFFHQTDYHREVSYLLLAVVLFMGMYAVHTTLRSLYIGIAICSGIIFIKMFGLFQENATVQFYVGFFFYIMFYSYVAMRLINMIIQTNRVSIGVLYASMNVYILLGVIGGFTLMLVENAFPGSLSNLEIESITDPNQFIYFSFVTLTTLGYGDITPISAQAQSICVLLGLIGPIYLTFLVAMLVGRFISHEVHEDLGKDR